ncbi:unnamed protein product [Durusdinium trenchii]|uniref:Uncharacterized protein n=1 Tax=Durusdinium trenchii TaxID=1381693 RepID=A0ABP0IMC3_9DINO
MIFSVDTLDFSKPLDHLELFAGQMSVTRAETQCGCNGFGPWGSEMDLATNAGFSNAVYKACTLREGGAALVAPVCSSWVFMSRGSTKRSDSCPMGDLNSPAVRLGNLLTARTIVILMILAAQGVWFALEQPSSSLMEKHVLFQRLVGLVSIRRMSIMMGDFAGPTLKPTWLYSSHVDVQDIERFKVARRLDPQREMVRHYQDGKGRARITGGSALKSSQTYPR